MTKKTLTSIEVKHIYKKGIKGRYKDPGVSCLYLFARGQETASWVLRTVSNGSRRDFGLGGYPKTSLAVAREKAQVMLTKISQGIDPIAEKKEIKRQQQIARSKLVTFSQVSEEFIKLKAKEYKTPKQTQKLINYLENYANPVLGNMIVADIEMHHVLKVIKPIWETKNETASRVRNAIERVLSKATSEGLREGENPARWEGNMQHSLPIRSKVHKVKHHAALPYDQLPGFIQSAKEKHTTSSYCLQFIILTAARSGEARAATWDQIDFETATWSIPADIMKMDRPHTVPLSKEALAILKKLPRVSNVVFANRNGGQLSSTALSKLAKSLCADITVHGFRSTFKDWVRTSTDFPDEVSELALAHVGNDATRAAYARDMLFDKRKQLMDKWSAYCYQNH